KGFLQVGPIEGLSQRTTQTIFLEAIETPVLFAAYRPIGIQGDFSLLWVDAEGAVQARKREFQRVIYKVLSDTGQPDVALLRNDVRPYPAAFQRYKELPDSVDPRIEALANSSVTNARAGNRYDEA